MARRRGMSDAASGGYTPKPLKSKAVTSPAPKKQPYTPPPSAPVSEHAMVSKARSQRVQASNHAARMQQRDSAAWAAPRSVFVPPGLRTKPGKGKPLSHGEAFKAALEMPLTTKGGQRVQATREQRRMLVAAQTAKRHKLSNLALVRPFPETAYAQPVNKSDAVLPFSKSQLAQHAVSTAGPRGLHNALSSSQIYPASTTPPPRNELTPQEKRLNAHMQVAGLLPAGGIAAGGMFSRPFSDLVNIGVHTPGGLIRMFSQSPVKTMEEIGKGMWQDLSHPLRYPDRTLLDMFGIASGGAGAIAKAGVLRGTLVALGKGQITPAAAAKLVSHDILFRPPPRHRYIQSPHQSEPRLLHGQERATAEALGNSPFAAGAHSVVVPGSENALLREVLHPAYDRLLPKAGPLGKRAAERKYAIHVGRAGAVQRAVEEAPASAVARAGVTFLGRAKMKKTGEELALRAALQGIHPEDMTRFHALMKKWAPEILKRHEGMRLAWTEAMKHVHVEGRRLVMNDPKLQSLLDEMVHTSRAGEATAIEHGILDPAKAVARVHGPRDIVGTILGHHTMHDLEPQGYVSYSKRQMQAPFVRSRGGDIGSKMQLPPELTKAFSGEALLRGHMPPLTTTSVGRVAMSRARIAHWVASYDDLRAHGLKPSDPEIQAAKNDGKMGRYVALLPKIPGAEFRRQLDDFLGPTDMAHDAPEVLGKLYETLVREKPKNHIEKKGVLFVPKRLAKELRPEASHGKLNKGLRVYDEFNRSAISAMLYINGLKYATVNTPGQAFLMMTDHGILAPLAIKRAAHMWRTQDGQTQAAMLGAVGGRMEHAAMGGQPTSPFKINPLVAAGEKVSHISSKILDDAPKITALYKQARRYGYTTTEDVQRLFSRGADAKTVADRNVIARKVMDDYLDYNALSASERAAATRIFRFYPWLKASTRYVGHYMTEHPVQTVVNVQEGDQAAKHQQNVLGMLPWYRHGLVPLGSHGLVTDPTSAAILTQAPELAHSAMGFAGKQPGELLGNMSPAITDMLGASGVQLGRDYPLKGNFWQRLGTTMGQQTPIANLLMHPHGTATFPRSTGASIFRTFVGGGLTPGYPNLPKLHEQAKKEATANLNPTQRVNADIGTAQAGFAQAAARKGDKLPPQLTQALELQRERSLGRIKAGATGKDATGRDRLRADIDTAVRLGLMDNHEAEVWRGAISKAPANAIRYSYPGKMSLIFKQSVVSAYARKYPSVKAPSVTR